jgi:hypothetical protein
MLSSQDKYDIEQIVRSEIRKALKKKERKYLKFQLKDKYKRTVNAEGDYIQITDYCKPVIYWNGECGRAYRLFTLKSKVING